ncbi:uncharacterized protein K452DRAFT_297626 [Aplosporella prunicola CBS 121167]|uniref:TauD/TfdA-like domain-containing protein n=1 Tax=Aplosporella prunicola CBS 121167 TaxID=1176127 RepID=A0A6A6BFH0_9PEZI|nr:uncharacterized protein K452DRAFT_297626 [Aplosporella prunicola CBS 121167]KAF2142308.1 hypothetical protein K452DRAFT_297626 [Aplosporella prunicola CBS 121167]
MPELERKYNEVPITIIPRFHTINGSAGNRVHINPTSTRYAKQSPSSRPHRPAGIYTGIRLGTMNFRDSKARTFFMDKLTSDANYNFSVRPNTASAQKSLNTIQMASISEAFLAAKHRLATNSVHFTKAINHPKRLPKAAAAQTARCISTQPPRSSAAIESSSSSPRHLGDLPPPDYHFLRTLVQRMPFVQPEPKSTTAVSQPQDDTVFQLPLGSWFKVPSRALGLSMTATFDHALQEQGLVAIKLGFKDPHSAFMLELVQAMGCVPDTHSGTQGALWDVTYKPTGVYSAKTNAAAHSISHSLGEFAWHTDGAFEPTPQKYFGLHVLHPDKLGGGVFRLLPAETLLSRLSSASVDALLNTEFELNVPPEFYKGRKTNRGKIVDVDPATGRFRLRFRADILADPPSDSPAANEAVYELKRLLESPQAIGFRLPDEVFSENVVLLMDNSRFLHSRTEIKDPKRLLRRVRFHDPPSEAAKESESDEVRAST